jgi:hypothetical protein
MSGLSRFGAVRSGVEMFRISQVSATLLITGLPHRSPNPAVWEISVFDTRRPVRELAETGSWTDPPAPALLRQMGRSRLVAADDFFTGLFETALQRGEIITRVAFPVARRSGYAKFHQQASHFALVGVFVAQFADGSARVAVTGAAPQVFRASDIEAALRDNFSATAAEQVRISADGLNSDIHASPDYRAHLIPVFAARAVAAALQSTSG